MPDQKELPKLIPAHGGYRELQSYQMEEIDRGILLKSPKGITRQSLFVKNLYCLGKL
jgi:hypothetical protein